MIKIIEMFLSHKSIFLSGITMNLIHSQLSTIQDMFMFFLDFIVLELGANFGQKYCFYGHSETFT